jgi:hypothetical protein
LATTAWRSLPQCTWERTDLFYARDIGTNDVAGDDAIDIKTPGPIVYNDGLAAKLRYLRPLVRSTVLVASGGPTSTWAVEVVPKNLVSGGDLAALMRKGQRAAVRSA